MEKISRKQCAEANARAHYLKQLHWLAAANSGKVNLVACLVVLWYIPQANKVILASLEV